MKCLRCFKSLAKDNSHVYGLKKICVHLYFNLIHRGCDAVGAFRDHRPLCDAATEHGRHRIKEWWLAASNRPAQQQPEVLQIVRRRPHVLYFLFKAPQQLVNLQN